MDAREAGPQGVGVELVQQIDVKTGVSLESH
jgi:hypothetical protein